MKKSCVRGFLICCVLGCAAFSSFAHPHVFVECHLTVVFDQQGLAGFEQRWVLDEMFTAFLFEDFDFDADAHFSAAEIQAIKHGAFDPLRDYGYFTHILIDGSAFPIQEVTSFSIELNDAGNVVYHFFVTCPVQAGSQPKEILISIFDDTYYTDVVMRNNAISSPKPVTFKIEYKVNEIPELTYYYGQIVPKGLFLKITENPPSVPASQPSSADNMSVDMKQDSSRLRVIQPVLATIFTWQKTLRSYLTRVGRDIKAHPYGASLWLFWLFSFGYGCIHALGPGHGKSIVMSYFLSHPGKYLHGALMGNLLTFVHVFSAVALVFMIRVILGMAGNASFESARKTLETISYSLLIGLGLFLLAKSVYDLKRGIFEHGTEHAAESFELKPLIATAFITGLVPCPGAALILIFAITQNIPGAGLGAMLGMAVGMGTTTTGFALFAIASRSALFRLTNGRRKMFAMSHIILSFTGALMILSIGTLLLLGHQ